MSKMSKRGVVYLALLTTLLVSLLYVRSRFFLVELSYKISRALESKSSLEQEKRELSLELSTLKNPDRIERIATQKFGLKRIQTSASIVMTPKGKKHAAP